LWENNGGVTAPAKTNEWKRLQWSGILMYYKKELLDYYYFFRPVNISLNILSPFLRTYSLIHKRMQFSLPGKFI
jgi:hypothetical protein